MAKDKKTNTDTGQPYAVLARKYRSRTFDEVVGQSHVADTLKKAINTGRVHHAYLFSGTRGVGKTSMARILAVALNDPTADGPTTSPDTTTEFADAVFAGEDVDVIEIDAASNTGVDNVRDLIENARFRPMRGRFKVYIIDEVHMLSKAAFNALLKIMEEPPSHVKFILATTEPEKVLPTILSRVQRFDFANIEGGDVAQHLNDVVKQEGYKADDDALRMIARSGHGSMRDALSLLDRLLSSIDQKSKLTTTNVTDLLGLPPVEQVFGLVEAMGNGDAKAVLDQAADLLSGGQSADALVGSLIDHFHALLIRKVAGEKNADLAEMPGLDDKQVTAQAEKIELASLSQNIAILEELRRQMRQSGAGRALLDATLVRLALAKQFTPIEDLLAIAGGGSPSASPSASPGGSSGKARAAADDSVAADPVAAQPEDEIESDPQASAPSPAPAPSNVAVSSPETNTVPSNVEPVDASDLPGLWTGLQRVIGQQHGTLAPLLHGGTIERIDLPTDQSGAVVQIRYGHEHASFANLLRKDEKKQKLAGVLAALLGLDATPEVQFRVDEPPAETEKPSEEKRERGPSLAEARAAAEAAGVGATLPGSQNLEDLDLEADPLVQAAIKELGARVVKVE